MEMDVLNNAITFAAQAHNGSYRKGTKIPYILHPMEAAAIVGGMTEDTEIIAAAVLHDTVEDTSATIDQIRDLFGERVAELVAAESEDKRKDRPAGDTWMERKKEALDRMASHSIDAKMVALGDKLSNMRAIARDCRSIGDKVWERFNQKDKAKHAWYYRGIAEALSDLRGTDAYREYTVLLDEVFPS